jgi:hypothetical protein
VTSPCIGRGWCANFAPVGVANVLERLTPPVVVLRVVHELGLPAVFRLIAARYGVLAAVVPLATVARVLLREGARGSNA